MRTPTWRKIALAGMMKLGRHRGLCVETNGFGKLLQLGLIKPATVDRVVPNIYKVKSAQKETSEVEVG